MKKNKLAYWIPTGLFTFLMLFSVSMYFLSHDDVALTFQKLEFPAWLVYPLAIAKLLGLAAILTRKNHTLTEWAYAGFTFNMILAAAAHIAAKDGEFAPALVGLVLLALSYINGKKIFKNN